MNSSKRLLCIGEALIDVIQSGNQTSEHIGGSVLNVASGLARLGAEVDLLSWWATDQRGSRLATHASASGVEVLTGTDQAKKTPIALARLDDQQNAEYEFDLEWDIQAAPELANYEHLHTGSLACAISPGDEKVLDLMGKFRSQGTVSYDPNIRPAVFENRQQAGRQVEQFIRRADIVKASDADIQWLYPDLELAEVIELWRDLGAGLVVITRGSRGAVGASQSTKSLVEVPSLKVTVADTVGAGDSFMAGLLIALADGGFLGSARDLAGLAGSDLEKALRFATATSGVTVTQPGAYAPDRNEIKNLLNR